MGRLRESSHNRKSVQTLDNTCAAGRLPGNPGSSIATEVSGRWGRTPVSRKPHRRRLDLGSRLVQLGPIHSMFLERRLATAPFLAPWI